MDVLTKEDRVRNRAVPVDERKPICAIDLLIGGLLGLLLGAACSCALPALAAFVASVVAWNIGSKAHLQWCDCMAPISLLTVLGILMAWAGLYALVHDVPDRCAGMAASIIGGPLGVWILVLLRQ